MARKTEGMTTSNDKRRPVLPDEDFQANFNGIYAVLHHAKGFPGGPVQFFGNKGQCRFCGENDPAKFRNVAHLVPEALGNTCLYSNDECDGCNAHFSEYESNLVDAVRPILTIGGTAGKANRVPQTGRTGGQTTIRHSVGAKGRRLAFMTSAGSPEFGIDKYGAFITSFPVPPIPFKPRLAYKALVKMAYALLPDNELCHYTRLCAWIRDKADTLEFPCLETGLSFGSLGNAPKIISAALLRRANPTDKTPYIVFILCAGSVCLMIDLMSDDMEGHLGYAPMGRIDVKWAIEIGPNREVRIEYDKFRPMNWSSPDSAPQPVEKFVLRFQPQTREGALTPVLRQEWR